MNQLDKRVFTTGEVADLLHIHQTTVIDWAKKGLVKAYRTPGGHRRVEVGALLSFLSEHKMPVPDELMHRPRVPAFDHNRPRKTVR